MLQKRFVLGSQFSILITDRVRKWMYQESVRLEKVATTWNLKKGKIIAIIPLSNKLIVPNEQDIQLEVNEFGVHNHQFWKLIYRDGFVTKVYFEQPLSEIKWTSLM